MALSNVFREPQRELTESLVGFIVFGPMLIGVICWIWWFGNFFLRFDPVDFNWVGAMFLALMLTIVSLLLLWGFIVLTHKAGEGICNSLEIRGLNLRPSLDDADES